MSYKMLYILVEGNDDEDFFLHVIKPAFEQLYDWVQVMQYATKSKQWLKDFPKSIKAAGDDYLFISDFDEATCITRKLDKLEEIHPTYERKHIQIVVEEIEGWYIAGLSEKDSRQVKLRPFRDTNSLTKEQFNRLIPPKYGSRRDFMRELLQRFSMQTAVSKNKSFRYFVEKYNLEASA